MRRGAAGPARSSPAATAISTPGEERSPLAGLWCGGTRVGTDQARTVLATKSRVRIAVSLLASKHRRGLCPGRTVVCGGSA
jgi:hypothetical protein